ncbi:probable polyol transporter 6 [Abrus precatorius]|uniref:Probable polyol transporter 6 n=1 Tax=Abrus precatorius TaxID=3816 RepID=A0A8B8LQS2_ABRPR|nr:probable polyol transporter 6 [Abrus precatorius]
MENHSTVEHIKHHYYYPLPASDSSAAKADLNDKDEEETSTHEAIEADSENKHNTSQNNQNKPGLNKYAFAGAILASTNSILLGYDIGVMSGATLYIREDLKISSVEVEVLVGCLNVCSLIGSLASGKTSDWIGRRYTIMIAAATFLIGALLMGLAPSFPFLMAGRVVAGIGVGYSLMISPVYVAELSPALTRGFLTSLPEVFISVGILFGYVSNYALSGLPNDINWRIMLGLASLPAIAVALGVLAMPESPRWLVMKGRFEEAKQVLIRTSENKGEAEMRLEEISEAASITNKDKASSSSSSGMLHGPGGVWKELLVRPTPPVLRILVAAIGVNFFMQASGNDAVIYYSPVVFKEAGIQGEKQLFGVTIIMGVTKTCFVFLSALVLDRFGRRPMLLLGTSGMAVSLFVLGLGCTLLQFSDNKPEWIIALSVVAVCSAVSFFSIGLGPTTWVYSSEIFPMRLRAQGSSLAISVNRLVSGIVSMSFLSVSEAITFGGMFFVLSGVTVVGTLFFYFFLPETKGKSLEEIEALFDDQAR